MRTGLSALHGGVGAIQSAWSVEPSALQKNGSGLFGVLFFPLGDQFGHLFGCEVQAAFVFLGSIG